MLGDKSDAVPAVEWQLIELLGVQWVDVFAKHPESGGEASEDQTCNVRYFAASIWDLTLIVIQFTFITNNALLDDCLRFASLQTAQKVFSFVSIEDEQLITLIR